MKKSPSNLTVDRMKMLMTMIEESHDEAIKGDDDYAAPQPLANGSVKHLAIELGKLCSLLVKQR